MFHGDAAGPGHLSEKIPLEEENIYILFLRADHAYRNKVLCCIFSTCLGWTKGGGRIPRERPFGSVDRFIFRRNGPSQHAAFLVINFVWMKF